jgi:hypothetical protein
LTPAQDRLCCRRTPGSAVDSGGANRQFAAPLLLDIKNGDEIILPSL